MSILSGQRFEWVRGMVLAAVVLFAAGATAQQPNEDDQPDPPQRVARIAVLNGQASFEPASVNDFSPAEINYPMTTGDRLYAGQGATAEVQTGQLAVRLGEQTDLTVTAMTDELAQFGLAGGSVHLRAFGVEPGTTVELDTPNAAFTVLEPGDIRVDVDPNSNVTYVRVFAGRVQVDGNGYAQTLAAGAVVELSGDPVQAQQMRAEQTDALDAFSQQRDGEFVQAEQQVNGYLNEDTVGGEDLATYGDWSQDADYGAVWYPRGVAADWEPYRVGRWAWVAPWGWTWVGAESWGFAPFHYGRWARFGPRWGWVPGPRVVRPVWAPALVVFVGGNNVTAWFPLGPREAYSPWYHTSPIYLNRVNVTNIYSRDARNVRAVYNQRTLNPAFAGGLDGRNFAYRDHVTAVSQGAFAAGRPVRDSRVQLGPGQATILPHPLVSPAPGIVNRGRPAVMPVRSARPVLDRSPQTGGGNGAQFTARPGIRPVPGAGAQQLPSNQQPEQGTRSPQQTPQGNGGGRPANGGGQSGRPTAPTQSQPLQPQPGVGYQRRPINDNGQPAQVAQPSSQPEQLHNRATPPEARPSFDRQRDAIQATDPGRPLSPRQMDNIRHDQPVQPAQQREPAAHPQPQGRPQAQPRPAPPAAAAPPQRGGDERRR